MSNLTGQRRIGLLQCGHVNDLLVADHGDYPELFAALLGPRLGPDIELVAFDVDHGEMPDSPTECDAWLVSGSASSTYEPLAWIDDAASFVTRIVDQDLPLVAVCFGHQLLAQAFGGNVRRCDDGWAIGVHHYDLVPDLPRWPTDIAQPTRAAIVASHQDQVTTLPDGAVLLASTDHCPIAAFSLGPNALAIQPHPEFSRALSGQLTGARRHIFPDLVDDALTSLDAPTDRQIVGDWMADFLTRS